MLKCPYTSFRITDDWVDCIQSNCEVWDKINNSCSKKAEQITPPYPAILINEFMTSSDLDNNEKIYGKDFKATGDVPPMLTTITFAQGWVEPPLVIDWDNLIASRNDPDDTTANYRTNPDYGS